MRYGARANPSSHRTAQPTSVPLDLPLLKYLVRGPDGAPSTAAAWRPHSLEWGRPAPHPLPPLCLPLPRAAVARDAIPLCTWVPSGGGPAAAAAARRRLAHHQRRGEAGRGGRGRRLVASPPPPAVRGGSPSPPRPAQMRLHRLRGRRCAPWRRGGVDGDGALPPTPPPRVPLERLVRSCPRPRVRKQVPLPALPLPLNLGRHAAHLNSARRRGRGSARERERLVRAAPLRPLSFPSSPPPFTPLPPTRTPCPRRRPWCPRARSARHAHRCCCCSPPRPPPRRR
jgi:hypothetical protein